MGGGAERGAVPRAHRPRPASVRPDLEPSPGRVARAACRDTRPAQAVLPACAAAARSAFFPRWWRWARGDCRRRKSLTPLRRNLDTPPFSCSRTPPPRSFPPARAPAIRRRADLRFTSADPALTAAGGGASLGSSSGLCSDHLAPSPGQAGSVAPRCGQATAERRLATSAGFSAAPAPPFPVSVSGEGSAGPA